MKKMFFFALVASCAIGFGKMAAADEAAYLKVPCSGQARTEVKDGQSLVLELEACKRPVTVTAPPATLARTALVATPAPKPVVDDEFVSTPPVAEPEDATATLEVGARIGLTHVGWSRAGTVGASFKPLNRWRITFAGWLGQSDVEVPYLDVKKGEAAITSEVATTFGVDAGALYLVSRRLWVGVGGSFSRTLTDLSRGNFAVAWSVGPMARLQFTRTIFASFVVGIGPHQKLDNSFEKREEAHASVGFSF